MRSRVLPILVSTVLLTAAIATPVAAKRDVGIAQGNLTWIGQWGSDNERPGRTSVFRVRDGRPGQDSRTGDRGWYLFSEKNADYDQRLTLRVHCVRVNGDWAEFAGVITRATGNFTVGNVFLVSVVDLDTPQPDGLQIGMKSYNDLDAACDAALDGAQFGRMGQYTGGRLDVFVR